MRWSGRPGRVGEVKDPFFGGSRTRFSGGGASFSSSEVPRRTRSANSETDLGGEREEGTGFEVVSFSGIMWRRRHHKAKTMTFRLIIPKVAAVFLAMTGIGSGEVLPKADGKVAATKLPLDAKIAKVKFETATFGLG